MSQPNYALTYVEIDVDYCALIHNRAPCLAALEGELLASTFSYAFIASSTHSFAGANGTFVGSADFATWTQTGADPILRSPSGLAINGAVDHIVRIDIERTVNRSSGTWDGVLYYVTSGGGSHGESGSFCKAFPFDITLAQGRQIIELDMSALTVGGTDWITHTVTQLRFDLDSGGSGAFKIYSIEVGHYASADEATGTIKCFNTISTCQDRANFTNEPVTLRFAAASDYRPIGIEVDAASIEAVSYSPAAISLGEDLGQRSSLTVSFKDHRHSDTGPAGDKYLSTRPYNPYDLGTFWGKFRTRQQFLRGRPLRYIQGLLGEDLADMETRHFVIESFEGPNLDGVFTITAKDVLKLADADRAQAPLLSQGSLSAPIDTDDLNATLTPAGIGNAAYPASGYLNIGGKEIVAFTRDLTAGDDANTKLLLHADGADASTTITDSSASARTVTVAGNLQLDTAWKKFGSASMLFDGTGDYATVPDHADWAFGTANFTVDSWLRISSLAAQRTIFCQQTDANNRQQLFVTTAGAIGFSVTSASSTIITLTSANGVIAINTDYHIALVRNGTAFAIYVNGVSVATATDADSIPNYTGAFTIGIQGTTTNPMLGWLDEFRVSSVARWTAAFSVPIAPYAESGDDLYFPARAQFGTDAASHAAGDRCQICLIYDAEDPADVIADLFESFANIPSATIPLSSWQAETAAYYRRLVSACIAEPTSVKKLVSELVEQVGLAIWPDDVENSIRLQVLRNISTDAERFDDSNIVDMALSAREQPEKRISQVWTFFGLKTPLERLDDPASYRSSARLVDLDAEENYGQPAIKKIFSRWIPSGGLTIAERVNQIQLGRYVNAPRAFRYSLFRRGGESPVLGEGCRLQGLPMQDATGAYEDVPAQITRLTPGDGLWEVEATEVLFNSTYDEGDGTPTVIFDANENNVDLLTRFEDLFPAAEHGDTVDFYVNEAVIIGSTSTSVAAMTVGTWPTKSMTGNRTSGNPTLTSVADTSGLAIGQRVFGTGIPAGAKILSIVPNTSITLDANASSGSGTSTALTIHTVIINVYMRGRIQGKGGVGGAGGSGTTDPDRDGRPGLVGGPALYSRYAINLFIDEGTPELWSGGGGGGGSSSNPYGSSGGGGGAGTQPGAGGLALVGGYGSNGAPGTAASGGAGGFNSVFGPGTPETNAGNGGGPGLSGAAGGGNGAGYDGGAGGAAGSAIDGVSYARKTGSGDIRGAEIN